LPGKMYMFDVTRTLMRCLREADIEKLGIFFARNDRTEVTNFFKPFPLNVNTARDLLKQIRKNLYFVMEDNGRFLAFSMLRGQDDGYDLPSFGIFVDWEHQKCGVGKRLSEWTFRLADQMGTPKIRLSVYEENIQARTLYERLAFIETDRRRDNDGHLSVIMHRTRPNSKTKVFASTQALPSDETLSQRLSRWSDVGIRRIELSNYRIESEDDFLNEALKFPGDLLMHHFFPVSRTDVVLNLASEDPIRRNDTFQFFQRSIEWSAKIGAPFFSFHAGYVTDPVGRDAHGFVLAEPSSDSYDIAWDRFSSGVVALATQASQYGVGLLIENNIVSKDNAAKLLLATPEEFSRFLNQSTLSDNIGILLDWGHWLVTANTYRLDLDSFLPLSDRIYGIHLHLNDGLADRHIPLPPDDPYIDMLRSYMPKFVSLEGNYQSISVLQHDILRMEEEFQ
jgi:sugar phosphate isomerase/epimerase/ribosomal protein S18 acetylase RimI-like enzyme